MTKRGAFLTVIMGLTLAFVSPATLSAQGEVTPGAFDKVDGQFATLEAEIDRLQSDFVGLAGRYLQTLPSTPDAPDKDTAQDYASKPADVGVSLADLGAQLPADMALSFEVHEYLGPEGPGYEIVASAMVDGQTYRRVTHRGPEAHRASTGWELYDKPAAP